MQRSGNKSSNDAADRLYYTHVFAPYKNAVDYSIDKKRDAFARDPKNVRKLTYKDVALKLLTYTHELGELEVSQQHLAIDTYPDLNIKPKVEAAGLELEDICSGSKWKLRISREFMDKAQKLTGEELLGFITSMRMLTDGKWPGPSASAGRLRVQPMEFGAELPYHKFFVLMVPSYLQNLDLRMIFSVGVQRIPTGQEYCHYQHSLRVWGIPQKEQKSAISNEITLKRYFDQMKNDPAQSCVSYEPRNYYVKVSKNEGKQRQSQREKYELFLIREQKNKPESLSIQLRRLSPDQFNDVWPTEFEGKQTQKMEFDRRILRWVEVSQALGNEQREERATFHELNQSTMRKVLNQKSVREMIDNLPKIPGFRLVLSEEQKEVIETEGSVVLMGRSGTGKTTCAVLRLFVIQMLFKMKKELGKESMSIMNGNGQPISLHSIFTSRSKELTREIGRFYREFATQMEWIINRRKNREAGEFKQPNILQEIITNMNDYPVPKSLHDVPETAYPIFHTIMDLLYLVDGTLNAPFFDSTPKKEVKDAGFGKDAVVAEIHQLAFKLGIQPDTMKRTAEDSWIPFEHQHEKNLRERLELAPNKFTQVTFETFSLSFWPLVRHLPICRNITAELVWSQIISTIKGSVSSYIYAYFAQPEKAYMERSNASLISARNREAAYKVYLLYQRWKILTKGYDILDCVNYVLSNVLKCGYSGPPIHYLMLDEVQDLPYVFILLFSEIVDHGIFFSGDSAQTISKGIEFRFEDIKRLFDKRFTEHQIKLPQPTVMQLTENFRSHNEVLQLANSLVSMIEILFPSSIDKLKKQHSDYEGPKPILLSGEALDEIVNFMNTADLQSSYSRNNSKRPGREFGFPKVVLVRDEQCKKRLPRELSEYLCLTIVEAKGLEFEDVLLYNFFDSTTLTEQWRFLRHLKVHYYSVPRRQFQDKLSRGSRLDFAQGQIGSAHFYQGDQVHMSKLSRQTQNTEQEMFEARELCYELKLLYTAITRTRNSLLIFDEIGNNRGYLEKIWERLNLIQNTAGSLDKLKEENSKISDVLIPPEEWQRRGKLMVDKNLLKQAIKCFEKSGDRLLLLQTEAKFMAGEASKALTACDSELRQLTMNHTTFRQANLGQQRQIKSLSEIRVNALRELEAAAQKYLELRNMSEAGKCFFSAQLYQQALNCFKSVQNKKFIGQCLFKLRRYVEATSVYLEAGEVSDCLESLDAMMEYQAALGVICLHHKSMVTTEVAKFVRYMAGKALEFLGTNFLQQRSKRKPQNQQQERMLQFLVNNSIPMGHSCRRTDRLIERATEIIRVRTYFLGPQKLEATRNLHQQKPLGDKEDKPLVQLLEQIEAIGCYTLPMIICNQNKKMVDRVIDYAVCELYRSTRLPRFDESQLLNIYFPKRMDRIEHWNFKEQSRRRQLQELHILQQDRLRLITNYVQEHLTSNRVSGIQKKQLWARTLILLGQIELARQFLTAEQNLSISFCYFDLEGAKKIVSHAIHPGFGLVKTMMKERLLWATLDKAKIQECGRAQLSQKLISNLKRDLEPLEKQWLASELSWYSNKASANERIKRIGEFIPYMEKVLRGKCMLREEKVIDHVFLSLYSLLSFSNLKAGYSTWSVNDFTRYIQIFSRLESTVVSQPESNRNVWAVTFAVFSFFRIRLVNRPNINSLTTIFGSSCLCMHVSSPLCSLLTQEKRKFSSRKTAEMVHYTDTHLNCVYISPQLSLSLIKSFIRDLTYKAGLIYCQIPSEVSNQHERDTQNCYKRILENYYNKQGQFKELPPVALKLLTRRDGVAMPSLLKEHILRVCRPKKNNEVKRCALMACSNQLAQYKEMEPKAANSEFYEGFLELYKGWLLTFQKNIGIVCYWEPWTLLPRTWKLEVVEQLLLRLMEKYLMMLKNTRQVTLEVFSSNLQVLANARKMSDGQYEYVEQYCLEAEPSTIMERILFFFQYLRWELTWAEKETDISKLEDKTTTEDMVLKDKESKKTIEQLVFTYILNIGYHQETLQHQMADLHIQILKQCCSLKQASKLLLCKLIADQKRRVSFPSALDLIAFIRIHASETVRVKFIEDSSQEAKEQEESRMNDISKSRKRGVNIINRFWKTHRKWKKGTQDKDIYCWEARLFRSFAWTPRNLLKRTQFFAKAEKHTKRITQDVFGRAYQNPSAFYKNITLLEQLAEVRDNLSNFSTIRRLREAEETMDFIEE